MTQKKLLILVIILITGAAALLLFENVDFGKKSDEGQAFFKELSVDNCSKIEIDKNDKSLIISLKADGWVVSEAAQNAEDKSAGLENMSDNVEESPKGPEYLADSSNVRKAIEKISSMKRDVLVSTNPDKKELFEVDSSKGLEIKIWDISGNSLGSFFIGKKAANTGSHYVRMFGSDNVYSVSGSVRYSLHNKIDNWRDKHVNEFSPLNVDNFTLTEKGKEPLAFEKRTDSTGTSSWILKSDGSEIAADNEEVDKIVKNAAELKCSEWEDDKEMSDPELNFEEPEIVLDFHLNNGVNKKITFGSATDDSEKNYWVKNNKNDYIYIVSKYNMKKFRKKKEDIVEKEHEKTANTDVNVNQRSPLSQIKGMQ